MMMMLFILSIVLFPLTVTELFQVVLENTKNLFFNPPLFHPGTLREWWGPPLESQSATAIPTAKKKSMTRNSEPQEVRGNQGVEIGALNMNTLAMTEIQTATLLENATTTIDHEMMIDVQIDGDKDLILTSFRLPLNPIENVNIQMQVVEGVNGVIMIVTVAVGHIGGVKVISVTIGGAGTTDGMTDGGTEPPYLLPTPVEEALGGALKSFARNTPSMTPIALLGRNELLHQSRAPQKGVGILTLKMTGILHSVLCAINLHSSTNWACMLALLTQ